MKKIIFTISFLLLIGVFLAGSAVAATEDRATQITKDVLSGPGSIEIKTDKEVLMSFGARTRLIPVSESDYDFGIEDNLKPPFSFLGGALDPGFFKVHANESGWSTTIISATKPKCISMRCRKPVHGVFTRPWSLTGLWTTHQQMSAAAGITKPATSAWNAFMERLNCP